MGGLAATVTVQPGSCAAPDRFPRPVVIGLDVRGGDNQKDHNALGTTMSAHTRVGLSLCNCGVMVMGCGGGWRGMWSEGPMVLSVFFPDLIDG